MKTRNVLIFPAGTEIGLEIYNALKDCKEVRLFGAGQDVSNHARFLYDTYHAVPSVQEEGWRAVFDALCRRLDIDYVFPAHDDAIVALSQCRKEISATILCPGEQVSTTTRSKSDTYRVLAGAVRVPQLYALDENHPYPVLVKPDRGQGAYGVRKVDSREQLQQAVDALKEPIICEYLPGEEYTVDCFSDRDRGLLYAAARSRRRIRNGIAVHTVAEELPEVHAIALRIEQALKPLGGIYGAWFFQLKRATLGELALLEVAPRIAGAMAMHRVTGVNFPLLTIFESERLPIRILLNEGPIEMDRALYNRYCHAIEFQTLYIDFDDTLVCHGRLNHRAVALVFAAISAKKSVILLTRHRGDLRAALDTYRLGAVFDRIVHLKAGEHKSDFIQGPVPILIDDSFAERLDVVEKLHIPTFDVSMIELLLESSQL